MAGTWGVPFTQFARRVLVHGKQTQDVTSHRSTKKMYFIRGCASPLDLIAPVCLPQVLAPSSYPQPQSTLPSIARRLSLSMAGGTSPAIETQNPVYLPPRSIAASKDGSMFVALYDDLIRLFTTKVCFTF